MRLSKWCFYNLQQGCSKGSASINFNNTAPKNSLCQIQMLLLKCLVTIIDDDFGSAPNSLWVILQKNCLKTPSNTKFLSPFFWCCYNLNLVVTTVKIKMPQNFFMSRLLSTLSWRTPSMGKALNGERLEYLRDLNR